MKKNICSTGLHLFWLVILIAIIDLLVKKIVLNNLNLYEQHPICSFFNIIYTRNFGIAFGLLSTNNFFQHLIFSGIATIISIVLIIFLYQQDTKKYLSNIAYSLIAGGAIGNLSDRLIHGFVVDYFDFYIKNWHWPTFNIADMSICFGVFLIILDGFYFVKNSNKKK